MAHKGTKRVLFDGTVQNNSDARDSYLGLGSRSPRSDVILRNRDQVVTFGVNWYVNRWVKVQGNVIRETIEDPLRGPLPSKPSFWSQVLRFQVVL